MRYIVKAKEKFTIHGCPFYPIIPAEPPEPPEPPPIPCPPLF